MRTGKGSGGVGGGKDCGSPRGLEKLAVVMATRTCIHTAAAAAAAAMPEEIDIATSDIMVIPEAGRDFGGCGGGAGRRAGSSNRRVPTQRDLEAVRRAVSL